ncbi:hypothetical protein GCM10010052_34770 [Paenarthrobacter histidinolovorans]|nr:hypothetical protein GCM10010052_34770 [Paenarthrobacter histidinolovorans]
MLADRGLGKAQTFGGFGETECFRDGKKGAELDRFEHGTPLSAGQRRAGVLRQCKQLIAFRNASYRRNTLP